MREALSKEEETAFQAYLQDENFAEEVEFRKQLSRAARERGRDQLKALFKETDAELDAQEESNLKPLKPKRFNFFRLGIAAAILLAVIAYFWLTDSPSNEALFAAHYEAFPNLIAPIDKGADVENDLAQALRAYERGDFQEAVVLFESLPELDKNGQVYYGLSLLSVEQNTNAVAQLQVVASDKNARYQQAAQWYLALAFLKTGDRSSSKSVLKQIIERPDHRYLDKAIVLDKKLRES